MKTVKTQQIPAISGKVDPSVKQPLEAIRNVLNAINKGIHPSFVTRRELTQTGLLSASPNGTLAASDTVAMPVITGFAVTGAFSSILLAWDAVNLSAFGHTEIHRASIDDIGQAVLVGTTSASVFSDTPPNNSTAVTYYYWVRAVNKAGVAGPFNATQGTSGSTSTDPAYALEILAGNLSESALSTSLASRIDLVGSTAEAVLQNVLSANESANSKFILQAISGDNTAAIQTEATVRAMALAPDWVAGNTYVKDDIVVFNGTAKICLTGNTDAAFVPANWADYNITQAQYTVKTDVNGKVAGFGLSNNGTTSDFIINVDKFGIATGNPADLDNYPFVVSGGSVYMKSALIQDASITNAKISDLAVDSAKIADAAIVNAKIADAAITNAKIGNLAVDSAKIADAAITNAKIGALAVDTLNLAGQAVTLASSTSVDGAVDIGTAWATVLTHSVVSTGAPTVVTFSCELKNSPDMNIQNGYFLVRILRNGVPIYTSGTLGKSASVNFINGGMLYFASPTLSYMMQVKDIPPSGNVIYKMQCAESAAPSPSVSKRTIVTLEVKR